MRPPILIAFLVISLCLAGIIEFFAQRSQRNGGLALSTSADKIPRSVNIAYLYLPTTISVIYSITWTWIDLDIRRIQPWLELSRQDGAPAEASILVDYPFEFLAFVPFRAWKRKHWPVFFAGLTMMIIFWAITPLQTAIFGIQAVVLNRSSPMVQVAGLLPLEQQAAVIGESILNDAYGVTWLGQDYPEYTTSEYAMIPFSPIDTADLSPNETWTSTTTKLTTDLACWPASVNKSASLGTFGFDNGKGCKLQVSLPYSNALNTSYVRGVQYIGYHESAFLDWWLEGPSCSLNSSHQFLAIYFEFDKAAQQFDKLTALFCETSYKKQQVSVTIDAKTKFPDNSSMLPLEDAMSLPESEFNSTAFEFLIGTGVAPILRPRDYPDDIVLHQFFQFFERDISWPLTPLVGFALGGDSLDLSSLSNPDKLGAIFASAHKKIFSMAVSHMISYGKTRNEPVGGDIQYALYGVVVSRPIAAVVEGLLVIVSILAGLALFSCERRKTYLVEDPASLGSMFNILRDSTSVLDQFASKDSADSSTLSQSLAGQRYALVSQRSTSGIPKISLEALETQENWHVDIRTVPHVAPVRPKELRPLMGVIVVTILVAAIVILVYLRERESSLGGLPRPSQNFEVLQILENYIPTVFATLLEPFLILLNRLLCILQPFHDLRRGKIERTKVLRTTYGSIPPQFAIWRALRSRHFLLAAACAVSLLANVLAVALGGLFNEFPVSITATIALAQTQTAALSRSKIIDSGIADVYSGHFYVVMANISNGTKLPPWTTPSFAFLPYEATGLPEGNASVAFRGRTRGFGVDAACQELSQSREASQFVTYTFMSNGTQSISVTYNKDDGTSQICLPWRPLTGTPSLDARVPIGKSAQEVFSSLEPPSETQGTSTFQTDDGGFCERKLLASWMRTDPKDPSATARAAHIGCSPVFRTGLFDVAVDASGYVLSASLVGDFDDIADINTTEIDALLAEGNQLVSDSPGLTPTSIIMHVNNIGWHNDTLTRDWMNYLLKVSTNSTAFVNPAEDVPDPEIVIPMIEDIYQRLFAALLGLQLSIFKSSPEPTQITGEVDTIDTRIFIDEPAFIISIAILSSNIIIVAIIYAREQKFYLPRMPSTIASLIAYVAASRAIREHEALGQDPSERNGRRTNTTYSFGRYIGVDGRSHVGVEIDPLVVPIMAHSSKASAHWGNTGATRWFKKRKKVKSEQWI